MVSTIIGSRRTRTHTLTAYILQPPFQVILFWIFYWMKGKIYILPKKLKILKIPQNVVSIAEYALPTYCQQLV